jgi:hypothetical protein
LANFDTFFQIGLRHPRQLPDFLANFDTFFQDLIWLTSPEGVAQAFPISSIGTEPADSLHCLFTKSVDLSRSPAHQTIEETCRLASLFYITSVKADSLQLGTEDMEALNTIISETQVAWKDSPETLLWILLKGNDPGLQNPKRMQLILSLMEVAKLLPENSRSAVKGMLIGFLWGDPQKAVGVYKESALLVNDLIQISS